MRIAYALVMIVAAACAPRRFDAPATTNTPRAAEEVEPVSAAPATEQAPARRGSLSRAAIRAVINTVNVPMSHCYETTVLAEPEPYAMGRVMVSFIIAPDGTVQSAAIGSAQIASPALHACMLALVRGLRFPEPHGGGVVGVNYPWTFSTSDVSVVLLSVHAGTANTSARAFLEAQVRSRVRELGTCFPSGTPEYEAVRQGVELSARFDVTQDGAVENVEITGAIPAAVPCLQTALARGHYDVETSSPVELRARVAP